MATYLNPLHFRSLMEKERSEAEQLLINKESQSTAKYSIKNVANSVYTGLKIAKDESLDIFRDFVGEVVSPEFQNSSNVTLTFREEMAYYLAGYIFSFLKFFFYMKLKK